MAVWKTLLGAGSTIFGYLVGTARERSLSLSSLFLFYTPKRSEENEFFLFLRNPSKWNNALGTITVIMRRAAHTRIFVHLDKLCKHIIIIYTWGLCGIYSVHPISRVQFINHLFRICRSEGRKRGGNGYCIMYSLVFICFLSFTSVRWPEESSLSLWFHNG